MLKKVVIVVLLSPFFIIALAYLLPPSTEVSRSIVINKPSAQVFELVNNLKKWQTWSPWFEKDPGMQIIYEGPVSGRGAIISWQSKNPQVGQGTQEIIESLPYERIDTELRFVNQEPASAYFVFEGLDETQTKLTWGFVKAHGKNPINRYMGLMFDSWLGPDYEKGLSNIKNYLETEASDAKAINLHTDTGRVVYRDGDGNLRETEIQNTQTKARPELRKL